MASASGSVPATATALDDCVFASAAPAVVRWAGSSGNSEYLGTHPSHAASATIVSHASLGTAFFGLRVPVGLKEAGKNKTLLEIFIYPEHISRLVVCERQHPATVLSALVGKIHDYQSPADIIALEFSLKKPATAIGPSRATDLSPKTKSTESVLVSLSSLVRATEVTLFFAPRNDDSVSRLEFLCHQACNGSLKPNPMKYSPQMLYMGSGGKDIEHLLIRFRASSDGPPSYDELAFTPPPPPSSAKFGKRLRSPQSTSSAPPSKKPVVEPLASAADVQEMKDQMANLVAEVAELRKRMNAQEAQPPIATGSPSSVDRLDRTDAAVSALQERVQKIEQSLEQAGLLVPAAGSSRGSSPLFVDLEQTLADRFGEQLDTMGQHIQEVRGEIAGAVGAQLDEMLMNAKEEVHGWATEAVEAAIETRLAELVDEHLQQATFVVNRRA